MPQREEEEEERAATATATEEEEVPSTPRIPPPPPTPSASQQPSPAAALDPERFTVVETERFGTIFVEKDKRGETVGVFDGSSGVPLDQSAPPGLSSLSSSTRMLLPRQGSISSVSSLPGSARQPSSLKQQQQSVPPTPTTTGEAAAAAAAATEDSHHSEEDAFPIVSRVSLQTQRFGDVMVEKDTSGRTRRVYETASFPGALEQASAAKEAPPSTADDAGALPPSSSSSLPSGTPLATAAAALGLPLDQIARDEDEDDDELFEFGNPKKMNRMLRAWYSIERDCYNWYGSIRSLLRQGWGFESFMCLFLGVGSTCFFCYYRTPEGNALAARLDFSIIGSAVVFPVTFLIAETFRRRENAIQRLASIKAIMCQIELAMLTWRWKGAPYELISEEWEDGVHSNLHVIINSMAQILKLPTWNTNRHIFTSQGREFKAKVIGRERELTRKLSLCFSQLHWFTEDLKEWGLPPNEASRINQYNSTLQTEFENLTMIKAYRTPNVSRSFVRVMILTMPIMYGAYFGWVSGTIGGGAQTNPAFAIALTVVTIFVLLGLVRVQRSMEDPFTSSFPGDVVDLRSEVLDTETRLNLIHSSSKERKRQLMAASASAANNT